MVQHIDNDIVYSTIGKQQLMLDAYRPLMPNGRVFIAFHDGDFTNGTKGAQTGELCRYLSSRGFTCFDVNYRLQKDVEGDINREMTEAVNDGLTAYAWVQKNAATYKGDPNRIAIGGMSAGAVIAMTMGYTKNIGARAVIDMWGGLFGKQTDMKKGGPPLLIIHGLNDKVINISMPRAIENRAISCQIPVRFAMHYGGHGIDLNKSIAKQTVLELIDSFIRETIR
jgi:predicted esterase